MNEADLFAAASDDDAEAVRNILADGVDVDARNGAGETPLLVATRRNAVKAARALMEAGADVNAKDRIHDSPYLYAGARGHIEILEMTLAHGADLESTNRFGGTTLIPASERGHVETVRRLIAAGVNVDHVNRLGWTALIEAIILSDGGPWHQEIVQALVDAGANVNLADGEGASPLSLARRQGHMKIAHPREGRRRMSQAIATNEARAATGSAGSTAGVVKQADTRRAAWPLLLVVAIVGLNLRPFITGVGPLAEGIRDETGLGLQGLSLLTLVPMLLMGLVGFAGPSLQSAVGVRRSIIAALAVLCVGSLLRLFSVTGWELIETAALIGCGAAIVQAMFPGVVKRVFPGHVAKVMGLYSAMLMSGGALGAKASPIIAGHAGSWHLGLAWLALPAGLAVLLAAVYLPANEQSESRRNVTTELLRRPRAWLLMLCFGLVNGGYSTVIAWLSPSYQAQGWGGTASGNLLAVMAICQAIFALILPLFIGRTADRRAWLWLTLVLQAAGFAGLAFWPQLAPYLWTALVGAGLGGCFVLWMVVALDHLSDPVRAGALSALMQAGGFLIAAVPPWIVAVLHDLTGAFLAGWLLHLTCVIVVMALTHRLAGPSSRRRAES